MKRHINIFFIFCLVAVSCTLEVSEDKYTTIQATFPEQIGSKVSIDEKGDDTGLVLSWEETDRLQVVGESVETFTLTSIDGKKATFSGKEVKGEEFDVILSNHPDYENRSYTTQTQNGVFDTDHLDYDACLKGVDTYKDVKFTCEWAEAHDGELLQSGCLLLYFQLPVAAEIVTDVTIKASAPVFYATNSASDLKVSTLEMNIEDGVVGAEKTVRAYFMTSVLETEIENGTGMRLTVTTDKGKYYKDFAPGNVSILPGKRNVIKLNSKNWKPMEEHLSYTFMTYNVGRFEKSLTELGHSSYPEAAAIMRQFDVDVVGLNEIESSSNINQPALLASEMGDDWIYNFFPAKNEHFGNAVVASPGLTPISSEYVLLPQTLRDSNGEHYQQRSLGVVEYEDFVFCVTHLDHHGKDERAPQVKKINSWIGTHYGNSDKPIILTGDMNATPGAQEIKGRPNNLDMEGLGDYWDFVSVTKVDGQYVVTYPGDGGKCIDYIFIWKNDNINYAVNYTDVVCTCPGVNVDLTSDHYPVYANITFTKKHTVKDIENQFQGSVERLPDAPIYEEVF